MLKGPFSHCLSHFSCQIAENKKCVFLLKKNAFLFLIVRSSAVMQTTTWETKLQHESYALEVVMSTATLCLEYPSEQLTCSFIISTSVL